MTTTTLEKENVAHCCKGCKECDPELQIKDLKGTIEGFQIACVMMGLIIILMSIAVFAVRDSREFWRDEALSYQTKYHKVLYKSDTISLSKSSTAWQDSVDLVKAQKQIHSLELQLIHENSKVQLCQAERGKDIAQYEYRLLKQKAEK